MAVIDVADSDVGKYGIIKVSEQGRHLWSVLEVVEKPEIRQAPQPPRPPRPLCLCGWQRRHLRQSRPRCGGEIQLTDAMTRLAGREGMLATVIEGQRFDAGDKLGNLMANGELGLRHLQIGTAFEQYLRQRFGGT